MLIDFFRFPAPRMAVVPKFTNQFLLLRVDTDNGPSSGNKVLLLGGDVSELLIPFRAPKPALLPLVAF